MGNKKTLTILGLGLIGGTYAKCLKDEFDEIYGVDLDEIALAYAKREGIITEGFTDPSIPFSKSDLIIIALYPNQIIDCLKTYGKKIKKGALISDVSGIKGNFIDKIYNILPEGVEFVGAHPMAGRETSGVWNADKKIFRGANFIITPHEKNREEDLKYIHHLAKVMGFKKISLLSPLEHDEVIAFTSQLTHAIAVALVNSNDESVDIASFIGDSYRDLTRIAMINEKLWSALFLENKENLIKNIELFQGNLDVIKEALIRSNKETLIEEFKESTRRRSEIS